MTVVPVILSGGSGTRLWPLSRECYPKQFLSLTGAQSLFQSTVARAAAAGATDPVVVCNQEHRFLVAEQLRGIDTRAAAIILEPDGRNSAPAAALAALCVQRRDEDAVLLVLPADHIVTALEPYRAAVAAGAEAAERGALVTFGVRPRRPETGFGYIRADADAAGARRAALPVAEFVEKPDATTAERYVASGGYYWNSGMFMFRASRYLDELGQRAPEIVGACTAALQGAEEDLDFIRVEPSAFARCPSDSIDYALMEHTGAAVVVPMDIGWSDVGSWDALQEASGVDAGGNVTVGNVITHDSRNCYLRSEGRLLAAVGVTDHVIVETADAVLVAARERAQDVRHIVAALRAEGREECLVHRRVYRPWGSYEGLVSAGRFQVKRIIVNPGQSLSDQMHHHRAEHWVIVKGTARVTREGETFLLSEDQSTYIPVGTRHRLENPGQIPLEVIEVQTGAYLGEDDIVRFEDDYGRAG
ncbi:MAG: mannose-1-phosphate guanylyltransferase/mannose-6-phosphate isomerase [Gammaproteobacteria bacterium]|nr:mannose-1-phosphate guanylyltransferase/mannose-6-phosphate isomerase [Gammaproteobacteria bacterium]